MERAQSNVRFRFESYVVVKCKGVKHVVSL